jgi:hypothetical protein
VVVKNRCFENWLIADLEALRARSPRKYNFPDGVIDRVRRSGADNVQATDLLDRYVDGGYCKRADSAEMCRVVRADRLAANSRSFRKLLRSLGHPAYSLQSRTAA